MSTTTSSRSTPTATPAREAAQALGDGLQAFAPTLRARPRSIRSSTGRPTPSRRPWPRAAHSARSSMR